MSGANTTQSAIARQWRKVPVKQIVREFGTLNKLVTASRRSAFRNKILQCLDSSTKM